MSVLNISLTADYHNGSNCPCPFNEFCSAEARLYCYDKPLSQCEHCNVTIAHGLAALYFFMGLAIFMGNGLIIGVFAFNYMKKTVTQSDPIKLSLAIADLLTGVQLFAIVLPELFSKLNTTAQLLTSHCTQKSEIENEWKCGVLLILCFSASLYHLILLGLQRLYAIIFPLHYSRRSVKWVYWSLALVWFLAIFTSAIPGIIPRYYYYCRRVSMCFVCSKSVIAYLLLYVIFLFIPFLIMTILSLTTAVVVWIKLRETRKIGVNAQRKKRKSSFSLQQIAAFRTVAIMQIGFSLAVGPSVAGIFLSYLIDDCKMLDTFEIVCFILYFSNSLINVIVYSVRDEKFKATCMDIIKGFKIKWNSQTHSTEL